MKKFLNKAEDFVDEMLDGIYAAHPRQLGFVADDRRCLVAQQRVPGKVGLATGGGSGHLPLFLGYVGAGLLDGAAVGGVFQSPSADQMFEVTKAIDQGAGVLYIYGNYTGDILNFDMATEMAELENIRVLSVVGNDDVASSPVGQEHKRRGVAGIVFVYKAAGAAAAEGQPLDEVKRIAEKARAHTRTMGVALSSCIVPEIGHATFEIGEDRDGDRHGHPWRARHPARRAAARRRGGRGDAAPDPGREAGRQRPRGGGAGQQPGRDAEGGALHPLPQVSRAVLKERGLSVFHVYVGEFATSMEMAGASISLLFLDDELKRLIAAPADSPFFSQPQL